MYNLYESSLNALQKMLWEAYSNDEDVVIDKNVCGDLHALLKNSVKLQNNCECYLEEFKSRIEEVLSNTKHKINNAADDFMDDLMR